MSGLSPKFPLTYNGVDGYYALNKTMQEMIQQNLKNLVLTSPGERIMDSNFGVGLYNFLFEQDTEELKSDIATKISEQVTRYMPFISLDNVEIYPKIQDGEIDQFQSNFLSVVINYSIPTLDIEEDLQITVTDF